MSKLILLLALALPASALAQDAPRAELSAGYAFARIAGDSDGRDPAPSLNLHGGYAAIDLGLGRSFGLELSASLQSASQDGADFDRTTLLLGPRFVWRRGGVTPFVHVLGGIVRDSSGLDVFDVSIRVSNTEAAGALGVGVDVPLGRRWGMRFQADYVLQGGDGQSETSRAMAGIVYRAGAR